MRFVYATDVHKLPVLEQQALEQQLQSEDEEVRLQALRALLPQQNARAQQYLLQLLHHRHLIPKAWLHAHLLELAHPHSAQTLPVHQQYHLREVLYALQLWDSDAYVPVLLRYFDDLLAQTSPQPTAIRECCELLLVFAPAQVQQTLQQHGQDMQNIWGKAASGL